MTSIYRLMPLLGLLLQQHRPADFAKAQTRQHRARFARALLLLAHALLLSCFSLPGNAALPTPNKIVVVFEENKSFDQIIGSKHAPFINALVSKGVLFRNAYGIAHPSQPNYIAFFSGSVEGVTKDECAKSPIGRPNLGSLLVSKYGLAGFATYSQGLPKIGSLACTLGKYVRKHNPASNWQGSGFEGALPPAVNRPLSSFPKDYNELPRVSFVIPDLLNDMHDGPTNQAIARGDSWLKNNLSAYLAWAMTNNSLLIVTWDEDNYKGDNRIPLLFIGPMVMPGTVVDAKVDHYTVLRTLLDMHGLSAIGEAKNRQPILGIYQ